ncbi:COPII coat Sec23p-Sfb3p heterodimer component [Tilletia horrida]|nr:COPII coat Sec23p-Sfb3p heterodimer component [Tilletia horrida]
MAQPPPFQQRPGPGGPPGQPGPGGPQGRPGPGPAPGGPQQYGGQQQQHQQQHPGQFGPPQGFRQGPPGAPGMQQPAPGSRGPTPGFNPQQQQQHQQGQFHPHPQQGFGQPHPGVMPPRSPQPGMPMQGGRPPMQAQRPQQPPQPQQQQFQRPPPGGPGAGPGPGPGPMSPVGGLSAQVGQMNLGPGAPQAPRGLSSGPASQLPPPPPQGGPDMGPARTKRSARAYHTDAAAAAAAAAAQPASDGWNDAPAQPNQAPYQRAAAERVAGYAEQERYLSGETDAALDQVPGQRNVISVEQQAANRARLSMQALPGGSLPPAAQQGGGPMQPPAGAPGVFSQAIGTPDISGDPNQGGMPPAVGPGQRGNIAQPPHSAGQRLPGVRSKISQEQTPSPVKAQDADQEDFDKEWFFTLGRGGLPRSTTDFGAVDQGNCSPKYMRVTTYSMPASDEIATASQIPIAVIVQPFAQLRHDEQPIHVVDCGEHGPPRCKKCRAYINPWCIFIEQGQKWMCNLCGSPTEVRPEYFCNLDVSGRRVDFEQRPELSHGTIDFTVPKEYWAVQTSPPSAVLLPVAPASTITETAKLTPKVEKDEAQFAGSTMGLSGQGGAAAKAATKAASDALGNIKLGPSGRTTVRAPRPMTYFFAIDVSYSAVRSGALKRVCDSIRETLYGPRKDASVSAGGLGATNGDKKGDEGEEEDVNTGFGIPEGSRVAILTFDKALHFYNLTSTLDHAQMLVVPDIEEPFVPISEGLLADPWDSKHVIEGLLDNLPNFFVDSMVAEAALGAAIRGAQACLSTIGGQVNVFLATIPTVGPGALKHREDSKLYGTDKEKTLFLPQDPFYRNAAEECAESGIGVNVFLFPSQYIDVATISQLPGITGGDLFLHPRFDPVRDEIKLKSQVQRTVLRETAYNATMRVRCSNGLRVAEYNGSFFQRNSTDLELGNVDADKAIGVRIKHDGRLDERHEAYFQCAILYTTATGERRVRCHNLAVPVTSSLTNVFQYADLDSTVAYFAKDVTTLALSKPLKDVRNYTTEKCVKMLLSYRRNCARPASPGILLLPESYKLFPLYALAINKLKAIKGGNVTSDVRVYYMRIIQALGVGQTMALLYPRMIALHTMADDDGFPIKLAQPDGSTVDGARIKAPPLMRLSYLWMEQHGAYLIDNGDMCLLWLGADVNPQLLEDLYGVNSLDALDPRMSVLPKLPTRLSRQVRNLVKNFATQRNKPAMSVMLARQHRDGTEVEFANNLIEDQNNDALSYLDYLRHVHLLISNEGASGKEEESNEGSSLWRGW